MRILGDGLAAQALRAQVGQEPGRLAAPRDSAGPGGRWQLAVDLSGEYGRALSVGRHVVTLEAHDGAVLISPLLGPGRLCPSCWHLRRLAAWAACRPLAPDLAPQALLQNYRAAVSPLRLAWTPEQCAATAAVLAERLGDAAAPAGPLVATLDLIAPAGGRARQPVLPRPDCPTCRPRLQARERAGARERPPIAAAAGAAAGIITQIAAVPPLPNEPTFPVVVLATLANTWLATERTNLSGVSGKGVTAAAAIPSAVGEAIERYGASFVPPTLTAARSDALDAPCIAPAELYGLTPEQARGLGYTRGEEPTLWARGLTVGPGPRPVYVPASAVYGRLPPDAQLPLAGPLTTNGLACGPTLDGAISAALGEVLERDAFFRAWYGLQPVVGIAPTSLAHAALLAAVEDFERRALHVHLIHLGAPYGVHVVAAWCADQSGSPRRPRRALGLGRGNSAPGASMAAMLELGQVYRGLTWALRDPASRARAELVAREPLAIQSPFDHALFHAVAAAEQAWAPLRPADTCSCTACGPHTPAGAPAPPGSVWVELTPADVAATSSWRVARALVPRAIPYHTGPGQVPLELLQLSSLHELRPERWVHPLC